MRNAPINRWVGAWQTVYVVVKVVLRLLIGKRKVPKLPGVPGALRQFRISKRYYPHLFFFIGTYVVLRVLRRVALRRWHFDFPKFVNMKFVKKIPIEGFYYGFRVRIYLNESVLGTHVFSDKFEVAEKRLLADLKPKTAIDVGAHMGGYSLFLARICEKVIAVEPQEAVRRVLLRNVRLNKIGNVIILPYAASSESGRTVTIVGSGDLARVMPRPGNVLTIRIDDVVDRFFPHSGPEFVKIDVEGHELEVLKGMTRTLKERRPILLIEVWEKNAGDLINLLKSSGYIIIEYKSFADYRRFGAKNMLFVPEDSVRIRSYV